MEDSAERDVLQRILSLYGGSLILRHIGVLYEVEILCLHAFSSSSFLNKGVVFGV